MSTVNCGQLVNDELPGPTNYYYFILRTSRKSLMEVLQRSSFPHPTEASAANTINTFKDEVIGKTDLPAKPIMEPTFLSEEQENDQRPCSICLIGFTNGIYAQKLICGHIFHENCIIPWLNVRNTCPICRKKLFKKPIDPSSNIETFRIWLKLS